jgi:hypothetical protein
MATFGGSGYGSNIYGTTENGGNVHRLLAYIATYQKVRGMVVGVLTSVGRKLGVTKSV